MVSKEKKKTIELFGRYVSKGKTDFYKKHNILFVTGDRSGSRLKDTDGKKEVINLHCNGGVFNLGHRNREIIETLKQAVDRVDIGNHHLISRERALLAEQLSLSMGGHPRFTVFGVGGGEAVDLSIKTARAHTGRSGIISVTGGYHGHTGFALAAGDEQYRSPFGAMAPGFRQIPFGDIDALKKAVDETTAAFIVETVPATLGMPMPPEGYLKEAEKICRENGALYIADEVQTGLGRTGKLWGFQHFGVNPDIVVTGKGLSGGIYPISATVMKKELEDVFKKDPFIHISTFGGAEIGCVTALKVLEISSDPEFLNHVNNLAERFAVELSGLKDKYQGKFTAVRQLGLMIGVEFATDFYGPIMTKTAFENDLLLVYANNDTRVVQFLPPLTMREDEIPVVMERFEKAVRAAVRMEPFIRRGYNAGKKIKKIMGKGTDD